MWLIPEGGSRPELQNQIDQEISELLAATQRAQEAFTLAEANLKAARDQLRKVLRVAVDQGFRVGWNLSETFK